MLIGIEVGIEARAFADDIFAKIIGPGIAVPGRELHFLAGAGIVIPFNPPDVVAEVLDDPVVDLLALLCQIGPLRSGVCSQFVRQDVRLSQ